MKKRTLISLITIFVILAISILPINAARPPPTFAGEKINIITTYFATGEYTISESDTCHIVHGWSTYEEGEGWSTYEGKLKGEWISTANFQLFIDGNEVELEKYIWYNPDTDTMTSVRGTVFDPYTFEPGTYQFVGVWTLYQNGELVPGNPGWPIPPPGEPPTLDITVIVEES